MSTTAVRIPDETLTQARMLGGVRGEAPGVLIARAWAQYWEEHREELAEEFDHVANLLRAGDTEALVDYANSDVNERAAQAVEATRARRSK